MKTNKQEKTHVVRLILTTAMTLMLTTQVQAATSGINPNYLKLKIYKVAISTSPLCTNLTTVYSEAAPAYTDFLSSPTIGSGSVPSGDYPCVVIEFSDILKFSPAATSDNNHCVMNVESTINVCQTGNSSTLINGTTTTCTTAGEDHVALYLSTASTATTGTGGHNPFEAPTTVGDSTKGFKLNGALSVSGTQNGTFVVNGNGKVEENGTSCDMQPPVFSFR